jgi:hypothetical protein
MNWSETCYYYGKRKIRLAHVVLGMRYEDAIREAVDEIILELKR